MPAQRFDNSDDFLAYLSTLDNTPDPNLSGSDTTMADIVAQAIMTLPPKNTTTATTTPSPTTPTTPTSPPVPDPPVVIYLPPPPWLTADQITAILARHVPFVVPPIHSPASNDTKWTKNSVGTQYVNRAWLSRPRLAQ